MEGELLIKGYKFDNDIRINFQSKTVIVGDDSFIVFERSLICWKNILIRKIFQSII